MKKLLISLVLAVSLLVAPIAIAQPVDETETSELSWLQKLPGMKQGVLWNFDDSELDYISTVEIASIKNIKLEVGFVPDDTSAVGVISYPILKLKDLGVEVPILDLIEFNIGVGAGVKKVADENEFIYGITLTLIDIKF